MAVAFRTDASSGYGGAVDFNSPFSGSAPNAGVSAFSGSGTVSPTQNTAAGVASGPYSANGMLTQYFGDQEPQFDKKTKQLSDMVFKEPFKKKYREQGQYGRSLSTFDRLDAYLPSGVTPDEFLRAFRQSGRRYRTSKMDANDYRVLNNISAFIASRLRPDGTLEAGTFNLAELHNPKYLDDRNQRFYYLTKGFAAQGKRWKG